MHLILVSLLISFAAFAGKFDYLKQYDHAPQNLPIESTPELKLLKQKIVNHDLTGFYDEFEKDGMVTISLVWGVDAWAESRPEDFHAALQEFFVNNHIETKDWVFDQTAGKISFTRVSPETKFVIAYSHERNFFAKSFEENEVVMYHGHSRYGRGPAFDTFTNYFRMGMDWSAIEIEANNPYFLLEPILRLRRHRIKTVTWDGIPYKYQYIGQKVDSSYLSNDTYIKQISGRAKDFMNAKFKEGKQLFWLYSCKNINYWKSAIRQKFPDQEEKLVFGTDEDSYWSSVPAVVFIGNLVMKNADSEKIVSDLNAVGDCADCFTNY